MGDGWQGGLLLILFGLIGIVMHSWAAAYGQGGIGNAGQNYTFVAPQTGYYIFTVATTGIVTGVYSNLEVLASGLPLPGPTLLPTGEVPQEQYEGVFVRVENASCVDPDLGYGEWLVDDGSGPVRIDDKGGSYTPDSGQTYNTRDHSTTPSGTLRSSPEIPGISRWSPVRQSSSSTISKVASATGLETGGFKRAILLTLPPMPTPTALIRTIPICLF